jgi:hypothetical protein
VDAVYAILEFNWESIIFFNLSPHLLENILNEIYHRQGTSRRKKLNAIVDVIAELGHCIHVAYSGCGQQSIVIESFVQVIKVHLSLLNCEIEKFFAP